MTEGRFSDIRKPLDYQAINVTKPDDLATTWAVVYLPTNEYLSHHEALSQALAAIRRYRQADARR